MLWGKGKTGSNGSPQGAAQPQPVAQPAAPAHPAGPAAAPAAPPAASPEAAAAMKSMAASAQHTQFAQLFSQAIAVLMRDANYKNMPLRELEHLLPPIMAGQCAIANAKVTADGPLVPVALALWARVSPAVDQRLGQDLDKSIAMKPNDWASGNIPWLITIAGSGQVLSAFIKQLCDKEFPGQQVKMRAADQAGVRSVQILTPGAPPVV